MRNQYSTGPEQMILSPARFATPSTPAALPRGSRGDTPLCVVFRDGKTSRSQTAVRIRGTRDSVRQTGRHIPATRAIADARGGGMRCLDRSRGLTARCDVSRRRHDVSQSLLESAGQALAQRLAGARARTLPHLHEGVEVLARRYSPRPFACVRPSSSKRACRIDHNAQLQSGGENPLPVPTGHSSGYMRQSALRTRTRTLQTRLIS
jgi:hypothetical protein